MWIIITIIASGAIVYIATCMTLDRLKGQGSENRQD